MAATFPMKMHALIVFIIQKYKFRGISMHIYRISMHIYRTCMHNYTEVSLFWSCLSASRLLQYFTELFNLPPVCTLHLTTALTGYCCSICCHTALHCKFLVSTYNFLIESVKVLNPVVQRTNRPPCNTYVDLDHDHSEKANYE